MAIDFFSFYVESLWGSSLLSLIATGGIFAVIGVMGRMSFVLLTTMLALYFLVFGVGFYGMLVWLPIFIISMIYFFTQMYEFIQNRA